MYILVYCMDFNFMMGTDLEVLVGTMSVRNI